MISSKDGDHDPRKMVETFVYSESRHLDPLESRVKHCMRSGVLMASHIPPFARCLLPRGGIPAIAGRRSRLALTLPEREDISRGIASGRSLR